MRLQFFFSLSHLFYDFTFFFQLTNFHIKKIIPLIIFIFLCKKKAQDLFSHNSTFLPTLRIDNEEMNESFVHNPDSLALYHFYSFLLLSHFAIFLSGMKIFSSTCFLACLSSNFPTKQRGCDRERDLRDARQNSLNIIKIFKTFQKIKFINFFFKFAKKILLI